MTEPAAQSTAPRWRALLAVACMLPLALAVWWPQSRPQSNDVWFYQYWSRLVTTQGISAAYSGVPCEGFVDYPPFLLYPWKVEGHLYRALVDPSFDQYAMQDSLPHRIGIALVAAVFHAVTGLTLFALLRKKSGERTAVLAALAVLLNPAALIDTACLGLQDSAHSLWLVLAFGLAEAGLAAGWACAALAALTKPQAWGLAPMFLWRRLISDSAGKNLRGLATAAGAVLLVVLPFIVNGKLRELLSLPSHMADVQPFVSTQAHNLWWLATFGEGMSVPDANTLFGPFSFRTFSLALLAASGLLVLWLSRVRDTAVFLQLPAFQAFAWFCLTTRAHENHWFFVIPLAALALPSVRTVRWIFGAITATGLLNLLLHEPLASRFLLPHFSVGSLTRVQIANSAANLAILVAWTALLIRHAARARALENEYAAQP